jgi:hypothetical protein
LVGLAKRLIEHEVLDADELRQIIEENSPSPQIVPGTATGRKRPPAETEVASLEPVEELRRTEDA